MPDKWAQYAQPVAASTDKWSQYAQPAPPAAPAPVPTPFVDTGNVAGAGSGGVPQVPSRAAVTPALIQKPGPRYDAPGSLPGVTPGGFEDRVARPLGNAVRTAGQDITSIPSQVKALALNPPQAPTLADDAINAAAGPAYAPLKSFYQSAKNSYKEGGIEKLATDSLGHVISAEGAGELADALPLAQAGNAMERGGVGIINKTVGARKADFARGASPGDGYFQAKFGPSASMASIADKSGRALESTGQQIGDAAQEYQDAGGLIPYESGAAPIQTNIARTRQSLTGPGGTGITKPLDAYSDTFSPLFQSSQERGGFLPTEYAAAKRNTAMNTPWNDTAQTGMKDLRQTTVGGMGGELVNSIPELEPLNSKYQNLLKLNARTSERALTGSSPLTGLVDKGLYGAIGAAGGGATHGLFGSAVGGLAGMALDSVPAKTSLASGLYYGGKGIKKLATALPQARPSALFR